MASPTPSGPLSLAMSGLYTALLNSSTWSSWCGGDPGNHIKYGAIEYDDIVSEGIDPIAVIICPEGFELASIDTEDTLKNSGDIEFLIDALVPSAYQSTHNDALLWFSNNLGAVLKEVMQSGLGYPLRRVRLSVPGPARSDKKERNAGRDAITAIMAVEYGLE